AIAEVRPAIVAHLAARSSVYEAASAPFEVWRSNVDATINLAKALSEHAPEAHLFFASSAECYGATFASGATLAEDAPLAPMNTYARSKTAAEYALRDLHVGGRLTTLRMFNQIGPGQDERFVSSSFAAQIARIELGLQSPTMMVGDLSAERDFCDVDDMIRALMMLIERRDTLDRCSTFNICSGRARAIQEILDILVGLSTVGVEVVVESARLRPASIARAAGSHEALTRAVGWRPEIPLEHTLERLLGHWRRALRTH
ncbi:MAG TPA: GDP-mannose 4,6-dehydratase, partial [Rhodocyclaceae bacterium]|nr:GDP-mannose 4,6-dehydratase [Rhodocyclaceae bacterium]